MARARRETALAPTNNRVVTIGEVMDGEENQYVIPQVDIPPAVDELEEEEYEETMSDIDRVQAEVGGAAENSFVNAFRLVDKQEVYLARYPAKEFTLDRLRMEYGGGLFRIRGFCPRPPPHNGVRRFMSRDIRIEEPKVAPQADNAILSALAGLQSNFEKTLIGFAQVMQQQQRPVENSRKEMLEEMLMYKKLFGNDSAPIAPVQKDPLDELSKMLDMQQKLQALSGGGGGESSMMPMMLELVKPLIGPVVDQMKQQQQKSAPVTAPHPQLAQAVNPQSIEAPVPEDEMNQLKTFGKMILSAAKNNADTYTYANLILDNVPDEAIDQLLDDPQWFEKLSASIPEAAQHKPWFEKLHADIKEILTEPEEPGTSEENTSTGPLNVSDAKT